VSMLEAITRHDTICGRQRKYTYKFAKWKDEQRYISLVCHLSVGQGSKHANEAGERKLGREGYLYTSPRKYEQVRYVQYKVSRGGNKRKGKKCLGVLSATDLRCDVGSTNQCSNCTQISELYPKARRREQGRRRCGDVRSQKAKVKDGKLA
jgi:hypothetical protein